MPLRFLILESQSSWLYLEPIPYYETYLSVSLWPVTIHDTTYLTPTQLNLEFPDHTHKHILMYTEP